MPRIAPRRVRRFALKVKPVVNEMILKSKVIGGLMPMLKPCVKIFLNGPSLEMAVSISPSTPPTMAPINIKTTRRPIFFLKPAISGIILHEKFSEFKKDNT